MSESTFTRDDIAQMVWNIGENSGGKFEFDEICEFMNLDEDTTAFVLETIDESMAIYDDIADSYRK